MYIHVVYTSTLITHIEIHMNIDNTNYVIASIPQGIPHTIGMRNLDWKPRYGGSLMLN
jgi:hypothetical protein